MVWMSEGLNQWDGLYYWVIAVAYVLPAVVLALIGWGAGWWHRTRGERKADAQG